MTTSSKAFASVLPKCQAAAMQKSLLMVATLLSLSALGCGDKRTPFHGVADTDDPGDAGNESNVDSGGRSSNGSQETRPSNTTDAGTTSSEGENDASSQSTQLPDSSTPSDTDASNGSAVLDASSSAPSTPSDAATSSASTSVELPSDGGALDASTNDGSAPGPMGDASPTSPNTRDGSSEAGGSVCVWTTEDLLAHVNLGGTYALDCGERGYGEEEEVLSNGIACVLAVRLGAGVPDAGARDAGSPDAGAQDAGASDATVWDAGVLDAEVLDAGDPDAGSPDAGSPDAGSPDAGSPDAAAQDTTTQDAVTHGDGARFVDNQCADCLSQDTFLHLSSGVFVRISHQTIAGEPDRAVSLETCTSFDATGTCLGATLLYECEDQANSPG